MQTCTASKQAIAHRTDHGNTKLIELSLQSKQQYSKVNHIVDFHDLENSASGRGRMYEKSVFLLFLINQRALEAGNVGIDLADLGLD